MIHRIAATMARAAVVLGLAAGALAAPTALGHADAATLRPLQSKGGFASAYTLLWEPQADLDRDLDTFKAAGAQWLRFDMTWSVIERNKGTYDWSTSDRVVAAARARGFKLMPTLTYTPAWARPAGTDDKWGPTGSYQDDFAAFAGAAALRYAGKVHTFELWNEENASAFWKPLPDASAYTSLVQKASAAIRAVQQKAGIVLGGLAAVGTNSHETDPEQFMHQLYALGIGSSVSAVGFHATTYPFMPDDPTSKEWNVLMRLPRIHDWLVGQGFTRTQVWVTEFGIPSSGPSAVSEAVQAIQLQAAYRLMNQYEGWSGPLFWYTPRDKGVNGADVDQNYGLIRRDFTPKPAFAAYQEVMTVG